MTRAAGRLPGDRRRLARALGHLVDNAMAATPRGGRILIDLSPTRTGPRVVVSDSGAGRDAATRARALQGLPPAAGAASGDRRRGLGLPLARQLIEAPGGTLELLSEPGQGTAAIVQFG